MLRLIRRWLLMPLGAMAIVVVFLPVSITMLALQGAGTVPDTSLGGGMDEIVTRIITQGGAVAVLIVVLWSYRRDFFRRIEDRDQQLQERREEKDTLQEVLEKSTTAIANSVNATTNQTSATHRLAKSVEQIEQKLGERRRFDAEQP